MNRFFKAIKEIDTNIKIILLIISAVTIGYLLGEIKIVKGILLILFASITAISFYNLFQLITERGDSFGIESSTPSIDGSIGGWKLSPSLTMLIVACVFTIPTLLVLKIKNGENNTQEKIPAKDSTKNDTVKRAGLDSVINIKEFSKADKNDSTRNK